MSAKQAWPRLGAISLALVCVVALQACGGGGGSTSSNEDANANSATVSAYAATRSSTPASSGTDAFPASTSATVSDDSMALAEAELLRSLTDDGVGNAVAVPPLIASHIDTMLAAASGYTLSRLQSVYPHAADWHTMLKRTALVNRQLWGQQGRSFLLGFLNGIDLTNPSTGWSGGETDYANGKAYRDAALTQALATFGSGLSPFSLDATANMRLAVVDGQRTEASWPQVTAFDGLFRSESGLAWTLPMLRISQGVAQFKGTDFTASTLALNGHTIMTVVPDSGSLRGFLGASKLSQAIAQAMLAIKTNAQGATSSGDMVLPVGNWSLSQHFKALIAARTSLPYDEINADFKGLDGNGGTYVSLSGAYTQLEIRAAGLSIASTAVTEFIFSERNVNGSYRGGDDGAITSHLGGADTLPTCTRSSPDLRSFFLVTLDVNGTVTSVAAVTQPGAGKDLCS